MLKFKEGRLSMGKKDTVTKDYIKDNKVFADAFNYLIYDGKPVIQPEKLHPLDSTIIGVPYGDAGAEVPVQKYRDEFKYLAAMEDDSAIYLLLGAEVQANIHYAMPVKDMVYDALEYAAQVEKAAKSHREVLKQGKAEKKPSVGEYLSGFYKEDRLIPVITLVIYFGAEEWDGPMSIHDMLSVKNPEILSLVQDYRIHLIAPASLSDEEINKFSTNLREVLLFIKYSKNKEKLAELLTHDSRFKSIDRKAVRVMNTVANLKLNLNESEGDMDMCQAIDEMISDARTEGREQGRTEGTQETMVTLIKNLMNSMKITVDDAMTHLQIPVNERAELIAQVIKNK
jgi:hypothetical protein